MTRQELQEAVDRISWYHTIDLGQGVVTPGFDQSLRKLPRLRLPADLSGQTVLDIGAWDGFYSFEAERRGAARVLAVDKPPWGRGTRARGEGFELARRALGSNVEDAELDVAELSAERIGVFDLVLFLGVLYHLRDPLAGLERVAEVTGRQLVLQTLVDRVGSRSPSLVFYPGLTAWNDATTWWGPNHAAVEAMLRDVGFRRIERVSFTPRLLSAAQKGGRSVAREIRGKVESSRTRPGLSALRQGWAVYHAFKER